MQEHMAIMHPVAFVSRKLTCAETRYTTTEHELLALVFCFQTGDAIWIILKIWSIGIMNLLLV